MIPEKIDEAAKYNIVKALFVYVGEMPHRECKEFAAEIQRRYNCHKELVEALTMCINLVGGFSKTSEPAMNAYTKAKQALKLATT